LGVKSAISWLDEHYGVVLLGGTALSALSGAVYWIARGGIAPLLASFGYLSDAEIAESIRSLPDDREEMIRSLSEINMTLKTIEDSVRELKGQSLVIMEFRNRRSQRINTCRPGEECEIPVLARFTDSADGCSLESTRVSLVGRNGVTAGVFSSSPESTVEMGMGSYQAFSFEFLIPSSLPRGAYMVTPTLLFSECEFAPRGEILSRDGPEVPLIVE